MKAAYIYKLNKPLKISNTIKPEKLNYGQLLIKNYYTGVCKSQIYEIYGGRDNKKYIPHLLGHEATGVVVAKHPTVKKVKIGDRVVLTWLKCKGIQSKNPIYFDNLKKINSGSVSTFSSHSVVSENRILKLPKEVKFCRKCTISNQRPRISFDEEGVCSACNFSAFKNKTNWIEREKELRKLGKVSLATLTYMGIFLGF